MLNYVQIGPPNGIPFVLNTASQQARGLIGWWPFLASRHAPRLFDLSGRGFHGTLTNGPTWGADATMGAALSLDGSNDYVDCGVVSNLGLTGDCAFTFSVWVNPSALTNDGAWLSYGNGPNNKVIALATNGTVFRVIHFANDNNFATAVTLNVWQLVTLTYDPNTSTETLYVNGIAKETWTPSNLNMAAGDVLTIGKASWAGVVAAACKIGEARIYNRPLTPGEVWRMYAPGTRWELYQLVVDMFPPSIAFATLGQPTALRQSQILTGVRRWGRGF
jgi:hypothetical protein